MGIGSLFRRMGLPWVVAAAVFVLVVTVGVYEALPTPYQSQAELAMTVPTNGNPYLSFNGALTSDVDLLSRNLNSQASAQQLLDLGVNPNSYTATVPVNALGPWIQLTVTGTDKAQVIRSMQVLITYTEQHWVALQQAVSAPADSMIPLSLIVPANNPSSTLKRKLEEVIGGAIVAAAIAILLLAFVDGVNRRRRIGGQRLDPPLPERSQRAAPTFAERSPQTAPTLPERSPQAAPTL